MAVQPPPILGIGVLEDLAVDRDRHALLDLAPETGIPTVKLENHPAKIVRLHLELGQPAGKPAGCFTREMDAGHFIRLSRESGNPGGKG
jgi:hypothetical protein